MTEITARTQGTALEIHPDQTEFNEAQVATLNQLGVRGANRGDLAVFFHQAVRTGLDPFAKQIYMIERQGKQTIQTGIDGFRLVARRAVDRSGETLGYEDTEWCGPDGVWLDVWLKKEPPAAARVTVVRNGQRFPAVALFEEYAGRKRDGSLMQMWATKGALMLAKCAEALALRKAFPQDLSGLYTSDEMQQAGNPGQDQQQAPAPARPAAAPASAGGEPMCGREQWTKISAALEAVGVTGTPEKLDALSGQLGRTITRGGEITAAEAEQILTELSEVAQAADGDPQADAPAEGGPVEGQIVDEPAA